MAITLQQFTSGETGYVAKLNSNSSMIEAALNNIQSAQTGANGAYTVGAFLDALFGGVTTLIGVESYKPTVSGTSLTIAMGACYIATSQIAVKSLVPGSVTFVGQGAGTYYLVPDSSGSVNRSTTSTDAIYSVVWTGSAFGAITRMANALADSYEENAARDSTALGTAYGSLDARLEAGEAATIEVAAGVASVAEDVVALAAVPKIRKVGLTVDGGGSVITTGIKGAVQVDFGGTIIGWSCVADQAGSLEVEISVGRTSPAAVPPAAPVIPDPITDKITASAPIVLDDPSGAQSAAAGVAEVATWDTMLLPWDVVQFNIVSAISVTRFTLYIRVEEN